MCGICGCNWNDKGLMKSMIKVLYHRGPDQGSVLADDKISLGHRRLSIIDLSDAGNQPMPNEDGSVVIVYNGEVYNFKELRHALELNGHSFRSNTDTEVIIHGYEEWGDDVVQKLNGMFAFCIYDRNNKKLFLARDRLGIKPLYYYWDGQRFMFASEIKALLLAGIPREVNLTAAKQYLQLRYIPGEDTLFAGVKKLLPGHTLTYHLDSTSQDTTRQKTTKQDAARHNTLEIKEFWSLPIPKISAISSFQAAIAVREILQDSVEKQLVADVPVGIYLSGGIDSSAIVALASKIKKEKGDKGDEQVKTFSVGFDYDAKVDELQQAKKIAEFFNTDHHEITVNDNISGLLPRLIWHFDMPHGDPVIIPNFKLSELASKKVKVVLSGEGSDEIFGGYVQYRNFLLAQRTKLIPSTVKAAIAQKASVSFLDRFFEYPSSMGEKGKEKVIDFLEDLHDKEEAYQDLTSILSKKDMSRLFTETLQKKQPPKQLFQEERKPLLNQLLDYDIKRWLPNYILYISDRMTMAHSIEGRVPFLDHRLVEFSTTIPARLKLRGSTTKFVLREAMKSILPNVQEKKHPFFMPLDRWVKEELTWLADELLSPAAVKKRGYFNYHHLQKVWKNYDSSKLLYGKQLFTFLNFELWHRMFIDSEKIPDKDVPLAKLL